MQLLFTAEQSASAGGGAVEHAPPIIRGVIHAFGTDEQYRAAEKRRDEALDEPAVYTHALYDIYVMVLR